MARNIKQEIATYVARRWDVRMRMMADPMDPHARTANLGDFEKSLKKHAISWWGESSVPAIDQALFVERCKREMGAKLAGLRGDSESWTRWALFDIFESVRLEYDETVEDLKFLDRSEAIDLASGLTGWFGSYGGPGRAFSEDPMVTKVTKTRILVVQHGGLDI